MNSLKYGIVTSVLTLALLSAGSSLAEQTNPYLQANNTWISISGTVKSVTPNTFLLDYGKGVVLVEMDDGDRDADAYKLLEGDKVTVNGMIDDDFYETTSIEASAVYVEKLGAYFYASAADEEDFTVWYTVPVLTGQYVIQGTVTEVKDDEFVVNTGLRMVTVDVDKLLYDPLDDEGFPKIRVGDVVRVSGKMEENLFESRKLEAQSIVKILG